MSASTQSTPYPANEITFVYNKRNADFLFSGCEPTLAHFMSTRYQGEAGDRGCNHTHPYEIQVKITFLWNHISEDSWYSVAVSLDQQYHLVFDDQMANAINLQTGLKGAAIEYWSGKGDFRITEPMQYFGTHYPGEPNDADATSIVKAICDALGLGRLIRHVNINYSHYQHFANFLD